MIFLAISFFSEVGNFSRLRTPFFLGDGPNNNYIPFSTISTYILNFNHYNLSTWLFNMFGNVLIFLPLGIIAPVLFNSMYRYKHIIYIAVSIRVVIEILQYQTSLGVFDIDDLILSLTGGIMGFCLYMKFLK
ncbi:VanZ family protein [Halobacillus naozhouensis]